MKNYLVHHGINGMHWGVRNGPPYPLQPGSHSASERKAGWRQSLNKDNQKSSSNNSVKRSNKDLIKRSLNKIQNEEISGISPELVALGVEAAVAIAMFTVPLIIKRKTVKKNNQELDEMYENRSIKSISEIPKMNKLASPSENMKVVNPGFPDKKGTVDNCMLCTTAMIMREKGYDVTARTIEHGLHNENMDRFFTEEGKIKEIKKSSFASSKKIINTLANEGDGAYGNFNVFWVLGGGHSIFWKNENGKPHFYDGQSGEEYEYDINDPDSSFLFASIWPDYCEYSNCTNAQPTEMVLAALNKRGED